MPEINLPETPAASWRDYWNKDEFWSSSKIWEINNRFFYKKLKAIPNLRLDGNILDIGCGAGYLAELLAPDAMAVTAADTSARFVEMTRLRSARYSNVHAVQLGENYTDLSGLGKFSLILSHSVVQYYKDFSEVAALIRSACAAAEPGAKILVADFPLKRSFLGKIWDAAGSIFNSVKDGYFAELLRIGFKAGRTPYAFFSRRQPSLEFSLEEIERLARGCEFKTTILRSSLSIYANRPSLLIEL